MASSSLNTAAKLQLAENYGALQRYRVLEQGDAGLSFYRR